MNESPKKAAIITVGVSASGKSTWAHKHLVAFPNWIEINRDTIREGVFSRLNREKSFSWSGWEPIKRNGGEKEVTHIHRRIIHNAIDNPNCEGIIISDTNLNLKYRNQLVAELTNLGFRVNFEYFPISFEEAVKRDAGRNNSVGPFVIGKQFKAWNEQFERLSFEKSSRAAVIFDVDGTLAHTNGKRNIYDSTMVHVDDHDPILFAILHAFKEKGWAIILLSGRDAIARDSTLEWFNAYTGYYPDYFYLRSPGDKRSDVIVKKELFMTHVFNEFDVQAVFDDRPKVCRLWRALGLKTVQLGDPHDEF
jgi:predicted kinase